MARPSKLTEELIKDMSEKIADGLPVCYTCDYFGVPENYYHEWMKIGKEDVLNENETIYSLLYTSIKKAYAQHIIDSNARIKAGAPGWQGTAWWLERTNNFFMPKQQIQPGEDGKVVVNIGGKVKDVIKK